MKTVFKKAVAGALVLMSFVATTPAFAAGLTQAQINSILGFLDSFGVDSTTRANVEAALNGQPTSGTNTGTTCSTYSFTTTMRMGSRGGEVMDLQNALNSMGHNVGTADGAFGPMTKAGVMAWQGDNNLVADGIFGPASRGVMNGMSTGNCSNNNTGNNNGNVVTNPTGTTMIGLATGTPAAAQVADNANANVTKFYLSAGANAVTVNSMYVHKTGLVTASELENIRIIDAMTGAQVGSTGSLNSNDKAQISFIPALNIPANTTKEFFIRAGVVNTTASGKNFALGVAAATDINASETFGGSFPFYGNTMTTVDATIGVLTLAEDATVVDSQPNVGDTDVKFLAFKLTAGSAEGMMVENITIERKGSAGASALSNIELYDVSKTQTVGTVASWDANGLATFTVNANLNKGETRRYEVRADVMDDAGLTFQGDIVDGSSARVIAKGTTFGFYVTPTVGSSWDGLPATVQTIQTGSLTFTKSANTPAAGNIAAGDDMHLASFDAQVLGESVKITSFEVNFDLATMQAAELTNIKLIDAATGAILAGPSDGLATATDGADDVVTFTDVIILPTGTTEIKVTGNILNSVTNGDEIYVELADPSTEITATGLTSNDAITPSPASAVTSNTLTIQGAALTANTLSQPAARSISGGVQDFVFATAALSAANSGEAINVTSLVLEDTLGDAGDDAGDIDNVEIWADLTSGMSSRGDVFETKVSTTKQFTDGGNSDETLSFTLNPVVQVAANATVNIAVVADLAAGATTGDTHTISLDTDAGDVTATGAVTGSSVSVTPAGSGQTMTVSAGGDVTLTVDSSSPDAALLLDDTAAEQTVAVFRLTTNNVEAVDLDSFKITDDGAGDTVNTYKFYHGATLIGTVGGAATAEVFFADGTVTIPADDHVLITVKAIMNNVDGTQVANDDALTVTVAASGDVDTTGLSSGTAIDPDDTSVDAATHRLYETYPSFAFQGNGTSKTLAAVSSFEVDRLNITANGNQDLTFKNADSNELVVQFTITQSDDDDTAAESLFVYDQDGNLLDTLSVDDSSNGTKELTIDFTSNDLTIPAGATEYIRFVYNSTDMEADGDTLSIELDGGADADVDFSVDGDSGNYSRGTTIIKSPVSGASAVNPS